MMKFSVSLSVLGLLSVASAVPAVASTINLNTGNGSSPYTIISDTLSPSEGTTVNVVTSLGSGWINDLSSQWIAPLANQSNGARGGELATGSVTYDTIFSLPVGLTSATLSITLAADDWVTIALNGGPVFYSGPTTGQWTFDTSVPISGATNNLLQSGSNTLEFIVRNTGTGNDAGGGPTGLDAQVAVNFTTSGVPEPSTTLPLALLAVVGGYVLRRRLQSVA